MSRLLLVLLLFSGYCFANNMSYKEEILADAKNKTIEMTKKCADENNSICKLQLGFYYLDEEEIFEGASSHEINLYVSESYLHSMTGEVPLARLGMAYIELTSKNYKKAYSLIQSAAEEGNIDAKALLAFPSGTGLGFVKLPFEKKLYWSQSLLRDTPDDALLKGNIALAMVREGKDKDSKWSRQGFQLMYDVAYNQDHIDFQEDLGDLYAQGRGTPQDYVMAYMMYDLSGTAGLEKKRQIEDKLTPEQIEEALDRSQEWQQKHHSYRPHNRSGAVPIHWNVHRN